MKCNVCGREDDSSLINGVCSKCQSNNNEGWVCPKCKTVLSPLVITCPFCKPETKSTSTHEGTMMFKGKTILMEGTN